MTPIKLERVVLNSGTILARPEGTLGTVGFSPKAWNVAVVMPGESLTEAFLAANYNWQRDEIES